jgi:hypothetical protein
MGLMPEGKRDAFRARGQTRRFMVVRSRRYWGSLSHYQWLPNETRFSGVMGRQSFSSCLSGMLPGLVSAGQPIRPTRLVVRAWGTLGAVEGEFTHSNQ